MRRWNLLKDKLRAARTFSGSDWQILLQAWFLLFAVDLGLRWLPYPRLQEMAARGWGGEETGNAADVIRDLQRLVNVAAHNHLYEMSCLRRSLALQRLLGWRGIRTELRFGVHKEAGELRAHAWLEYDGQPIGEPGAIAARFAVLAAGEGGQ